MSRLFALLILFSACFSNLRAQPFDTIITRFQYLSQIYPLEDSTFILIGQKDGIVIERMNRRAEAIWTLRLGLQNDDVIKSIVHCEPRDSSIQVYTARRDCDIYDGKDAIIYTLTFSGELKDSLKVPYEYNPRYISLLSGNDEFPRLAYPRQNDVKDPEVILMYSNGDTMHIRPSIPGQDTSLQDLIGYSKVIALSPDSQILVCTSGYFTFSFEKSNGRYSIVNRTLTFGFFARDIFCLEPDFFIVQHKEYLTLYYDRLPVTNFPLNPGEFFGQVIWQNPYLMVTKNSISGNDSIFVLDRQLNIIDKRSADFFSYYPFSISYRDQTYYWTSQPYHYLEGAAIHSLNIVTMDGPDMYDVSIEDVYVPAYDHYTTEYTCISKIAYYHFPYIIVTVVNQSEKPISHIDVIHEYSCFCPPTWHWIRPIDNMDLQPGETDTFWLKDITIFNYNGIRYPLKICLDIIHPDFHRDANPYPDNGICKTISLRESYPFTSEEIVRYFPNPAESSLTLYTEDTMAYNLDIFDTSGRPVYETREYPGGYADVDITNLPQGLYYLRFRFENGISTQGKFTKL